MLTTTLNLYPGNKVKRPRFYVNRKQIVVKCAVLHTIMISIYVKAKNKYYFTFIRVVLPRGLFFFHFQR